VSYEPLHHKYRPQIFADLVGQEAISSTLTNAIRQEKIAPAYLFTGSRGTGKTSSARIIAKSLNCLSSDKPTEIPCGKCEVCRAIALGSALDVIEIDAASNTGVDNIREIIERAQFAPVQCRYKVYVIDECHMLSAAAFNALLKTLEEPPHRVIFVLATTDPQRVLPTIISRCQRFDFRRIPLESMVKHLRKIADIENIKITDEAITLIAQVAQGGLRDAESLLDQLSLLEGEIAVDRVWDLVGAVPERDLLALLEAIDSTKPEAILDRTRQLMDRGREPLIVLQNLAGFYRDLLIAKTSPHRSNLVALTSPTWTQLCEFAQKWDLNRILAGQTHLKTSELQIKNTTQPRLWLEVTLLGLLHQEAPVTVIYQQPAPPPQELNIKHQEPTFKPPETKFKPQEPAPKPTNSQVSSSPPDSSSTARAPIDPQTVELEEVWQKLLERIRQRSTQALLKQYGHLGSLNGNVALVYIRSLPLLQTVQKNGLAIIEAAFEELCGYKVKVKLDVPAATQPKKSASEPPSKSTLKESFKVNEYQTPVQESPNGSKPVAPVEPAAQKEASPPPSVVPKIETAKEENEVAIAARHLANFFNGTVVNFSPEKVLEPSQLAIIDRQPAVTTLELAADTEDDPSDF